MTALCDPDASVASTRRTYSPGAPNLAVVTARPLASTFGEASLKLTAPGPRYLLQATPAAGPGRAAVPLPLRTPSSVAQRASVTGPGNVAFSAIVTPPGPCAVLP